MKLSKYVLPIALSDNKTILYNTTNEAIVVVNSESINYDNIMLDEQSLNYLRDYDFFIEDESALKVLLKARESRSDTLIITISFTQECNLKCTYCSQNDSKSHGVIEDETLNDIVSYIDKCLKLYHYKYVAINLFGGEPLIAKEKILYFKDILESKINPNIIRYAIVTNGTLLTKDFLAKFEQIIVKITLTEKSDHDSKRIYKNGVGSFDDIVTKISSCKELFNERRCLNLRYNISFNYESFEEFVCFVTSKFPYVNYIEVSPIYDYEFNEKKQAAILEEFSQWYCGRAIDILLKYNFFVEFPTIVLRYCRAYSEHDVKIFPDGSLAICDAQNYNSRRGKIKDIVANPEFFKQLYQEYKASPVDAECKQCKNIFLCGGKQLCKRNNYCRFLEYSLDAYMKKYIEYYSTEKERFFLTLQNQQEN